MDLNELNNPAEPEEQKKLEESKQRQLKEEKTENPQPSPNQPPPHQQPPPNNQYAEGYGGQQPIPMMGIYPHGPPPHGPPPPLHHHHHGHPPPPHGHPPPPPMYGNYGPMYPVPSPYMQQYPPGPAPAPNHGHASAPAPPQPQPEAIPVSAQNQHESRDRQDAHKEPHATPEQNVRSFEGHDQDHDQEHDDEDPHGENQTPVSTRRKRSKSTENHSDDSSRQIGQYHYTKRNHNRTYHTLVSGSKLRHLKKKDGEPLWRADIQYDFLMYIFNNQEKVFTNVVSKEGGMSFADIYIDAMARSSKCSKILRDKLRGDKQAGVNMAMVCLLVNIGRMNTTLNFFPEMKARLRTYHAIPSLQTYSDQFAYKQLQDAPRLKSILKGACEDTSEPSSLEDLDSSDRLPKTNPINLVFLLSTYEPKVTARFFPEEYDFFDLIMNQNLSSESRGRVFLWLMWCLLQTNLTKEEMQKNPFGLGTEDGTKIPELDKLTEEQINEENVDTPEEKLFGYQMEKERSAYLDSSTESQIRNKMLVPGSSGPVHSTPNRAGPWSSSNKSTPASVGASGGGRSLRSRDKPPSYKLEEEHHDEEQDKRSPSPPRKPKGRRGGKPALAELRLQKCHKEVEKMLVGKDRRRRRARYLEGAIRRTWEMIKDLDPIYNSEDEAAVRRVAETNRRSRKRERLPHPTVFDDYANIPVVNTSKDDFGEESTALATSLRRAGRWARRWKTGEPNGHYHDRVSDQKAQQQGEEHYDSDIDMGGVRMKEETAEPERDVGDPSAESFEQTPSKDPAPIEAAP